MRDRVTEKQLLSAVAAQAKLENRPTTGTGSWHLKSQGPRLYFVAQWTNDQGGIEAITQAIEGRELMTWLKGRQQGWHLGRKALGEWAARQALLATPCMTDYKEGYNTALEHVVEHEAVTR